MQNDFQQNSVLKFTHELNINNKLPFLDLLIDNNNDNFNTKVYHKPTNSGQCLNGNSQCPEKYMNSVINSYIHRAYKASSTWENFNSEIQHTKQTLVNNGYSNRLIDEKVKQYLDNTFNNQQIKTKTNHIQVFYKNQMHERYKIDERVIKEIVQNNTKCNDPNKKLKIIFYYKNNKTSNLVMRNNLNKPLEPLQQNNIIYRFTCPLLHGEATQTNSKTFQYIGYSQCSLRNRLQNHTYKGSIRNHFNNSHNITPKLDQLIDNTTIINKGKDKQELLIKEALHIQQQCPLINKQFDSFPNILKLFNVNSHIPPPTTPTPLQLNSNSNTLPNQATQIIQNIQSNDTSLINSTLHTVSPNIRNRIDTFINSYRNNNNNNQPSSPPLTRSRTHALTHLSTQHLSTHTLDQSPLNNTRSNT